jgi:hypothetical protein
VDPDNRLVAAELERRWNECLEAVCRLETDLSNAHCSAPSALSQQERQSLLALGADLSRAWDHPKASAETRKRIVRTVLKEILVRVQDGQIKWFCIGKAATIPPSPCPRTRPANIGGGPTSTP